METQIARAVDVVMARAKRIYILIIKVNKLFSFFSSRCFLKKNGKHVPRVSIKLQKHSWKFGRTRKSRGNTSLRPKLLPNFHSCFYLTIGLWARDFYCNGLQWFSNALLNFIHKQRCKYRAVLGKFAVVYARTRFFNIFKFLHSRDLKSVSFSPLRNSITPLHLKSLPKLRKNYKNIAFQGRPAANCTLMADSIRVAQPIRLQHLHKYTSGILLKLDRNTVQFFYFLKTKQ